MSHFQFLHFILQTVFSLSSSSFDTNTYCQIETPSIIAFSWDKRTYQLQKSVKSNSF